MEELAGPPEGAPGKQHWSGMEHTPREHFDEIVS
jgi:hypothetical protein